MILTSPFNLCGVILRNTDLSCLNMYICVNNDFQRGVKDMPVTSADGKHIKCSHCEQKFMFNYEALKHEKEHHSDKA